MKNASIFAQESSNPTKFQSGIGNRFTRYAAAAGATLASATAGQAAVISWDLSGYSEESRTVVPGSTLYLDLNAASVEGVITETAGEGADFSILGLTQSGKTKTAMQGADNPKSNSIYWTLPSGEMVDASASPSSSWGVVFEMADGASTPSVNAFDPDFSGYLGLRFLIGGNTHYGWVQLTITDTTDAWVRIDGLAYNTVADQGIMNGGVIPEPGTMALLATGAAGLLAWRARRRAA